MTVHDQGLSWCHGEVIAIKNAKKKTVIVKWAEGVWVGTKNSRPVGLYSRNSTKSTVNPNTTIPQI